MERTITIDITWLGILAFIYALIVTSIIGGMIVTPCQDCSHFEQLKGLEEMDFCGSVDAEEHWHATVKDKDNPGQTLSTIREFCKEFAKTQKVS